MKLRVLSLALSLACCKSSQQQTPAPQVPSVTAASSISPDVPPPQAAPTSAGRNVLPLTAGAEYHFKGTFRGTEYLTNYTLQSVVVDGETAFYFGKSEAIGSNTSLLDQMGIGLGVWSIRADGFYTANAGFLSDTAKLKRGDFQRVLQVPILVGATEEVRIAPVGDLVPGMQMKLTVVGMESVTVPAGTFPNCVHLQSDVTIEGSVETAEIWLAPNVGIVRYLRATGRNDELVSYKIP